MPEITETSLGFPLKGTLRRSPFPKIVRQIARTKTTGSLFLLNGKTKKVVFFERGEPISVRSNVTSECLGQILAQEGLITQSQCDQTLESIRRTGKKQGELLVEMGILSEGNLRYGLEAQLRHKLYDIFAWDDARYQFKPDVEGEDYGLRFPTSAQGIIVNALIDITDEERATKALEPYASRYPLVDPKHGLELDVMTEEAYFLACLDGSTSIAELLEAEADPPIPSAALLLYATIQAGVAKLAKSSRKGRARDDKPLDGRRTANSELDPGYAAQSTITTFEDTPLPGQLPKALDTDFDAEFGDEQEESSESDEPPGLSYDEPGVPRAAPLEVSSLLTAAEADAPDEAFEEAEAELAGLEEVHDENNRASLVADPAESGVFAAVLEDDDDDAEALEPEPVEEPEPIEELDDLEEIEEIEEIEELEELEELDDADPAMAADPNALADDLDPGDSLAALADDLGDDLDDLALDGDLDLADGDDLDDIGEDLDLGEGSELADLAADLGDIDDDLALDAEGSDLDDDSELVGLDDLDDLDLSLGDLDPNEHSEAELTMAHRDAEDSDETPEVRGAKRFTEGEGAIAEGDWASATTHFEAAYEFGIDVAELHTMLAWARFQGSGETPDMATHALELLAYAEQMNPNLAMVYAYRSAVYVAQGDSAAAQDAAQRALDIDPYDELAIDVMDKLV